MEITKRPQITVDQINENQAKFTITPLEPGFGYTVGNSLRKTLLGSIPGAAVTSVKVDGVSHEFQAVEGVKEDMVEIIQNVKGLIVSSIIDEPVTVFINKKDAGEITAADIKVSAGVEIFNKDHHICTLSKGSFVMELVIERGRGYVPASTSKRKGGSSTEIGRIAVDSIYSPVLKVSFNVEATRVGEHTNFDNLTINVTTKSSISPTDAMASAGKTLTEIFGLVNHLNINAEGLDMPQQNLFDYSAPITSVQSVNSVENSLSNNSAVEVDSISIRDLPFKDTVISTLERNGIETLGILLTYSEEDLNKIDKVGPAKVKQIAEVLSAEGYSLAEQSKK